ncbi:radical SAM/SPASM domain-containing protein [Mucilaginibacter psychrotolerans]|uniref:Radical SAM protein n=1 Tax=Mucilaginibacter psychrotolerans TaxID=1524096 RepID=A0A4Y8S7I2_9SPHI|nr:radical SAM protein [Mucilaginibacter psychrotolerans]TFF34571.1 radical SAM protein [Mucilaginibacter psychrotolerans]
MNLLQPEEFQLTDNPIPILVQLGLTYKCNLKCDHCYALYHRDLNELSYDELKDLMTQLYNAGSCSVVYSHGENLIRKDFHEIAKMISGFDIYQTLMTNGFYLQTEEEVSRLKETGINRVLVSIDSPRKEVHDRVRGVEGAFEKAVSSLRMLQQGGIPTVGFSTTIDVHNYNTVRELVEMAKSMGLGAISLMQNRYNKPGIFMHDLWIDYVDTCKSIYELILENEGIIDIYTHDPFMLTLLDQRMTNNDKRAAFIGSNLCNVATSMVSIDPVGNISGCNFIEEIIGNVRNEPFISIWDRLVKRYNDKDAPPDGPCSGCNAVRACVGGCKAFHYNGKYDERCGKRRFGEDSVHEVTELSLPNYPTAPSFKTAAKYNPRIK